VAKPYASEMGRLAETFAWANAADTADLRKAVMTSGNSPIRAIGSGGSLTAAHALASLHQRWTNQMATVVTPLDAMAEPLHSAVASWLLSAGGGNVDILAAFRNIAALEPRQLCVLCGRGDSSLADLARSHPFVDLLVYPPPAGKDGFLATNSLLAFVTLLAKAYLEVFGTGAETWEGCAKQIQQFMDENAVRTRGWRSDTEGLWDRQTTLVLHGATTRVGAIDLESKFTEAALGNLQLADYRNFAHGRHHWLAKRGEHTAIIAFISDEDRALAEKTLALVPAEIPMARLDFPGFATTAAIGSLVAALRITGWAGTARGIDPGRPGVPDFGRKLYNLPLPRTRSSRPKQLVDRDAVAITRKAGVVPGPLLQAASLERWRSALGAFRDRVLTTSFGGVILDYDGTIVDTRHRFVEPRRDIMAELARLAEGDARVAIATGRGVSVRRDLQATLPQGLWPRILVGYYNGADIAPLDDDKSPDGGAAVCEDLKPLASALRAHPELIDVAEQTDRRFQITLEAKLAVPENRLWDIAHEVILASGCHGARVTRSSHSVDILAKGVSKLNVLQHMHQATGDAPLLTIGDRGRWPGNDYELLHGPYSLSVDEVSVDPNTCWNLAARGQRGVAATLAYLQALRVQDGSLRFDKAAFR
jgi:fructoselysine-6-P-deglycase FrlB-like protein